MTFRVHGVPREGLGREALAKGTAARDFERAVRHVKALDTQGSRSTPTQQVDGSQPPLPAKQAVGSEIAGHSQNSQDKKPDCLSLEEGPVGFTGGGLDLSLGVGAGLGVYYFTVPSGKTGWVVSGAGFVGLGGSLGATYGVVDKLGNFLGEGFRLDAEIPGIPNVGGEAILSSSGEPAGAAATLAAGGGAYGGKTQTKLLSSSTPLCEQ